MRPLTAEIINNNQLPSNSVIRDKKNVSRGNIRKKKFMQSKMCEKRKNGAGCIRGIKNVNLNKIQRSNERVSQDKGSLERHNDSPQNERQ